MIVSISGAQGQGKSTTLASLQLGGLNIIELKTARSVLSEWNIGLPEIYADRVLAMKFHEALIVRHDENCAPYYNQDDVFFMERSYADIFAYALAVTGHFNDCSEWLNQFYDKCSALQSKLSGVIYLSGRVYTPEEDGVRSTNIHFSKVIDLSIENYSREFANNTHTHRVYHVSRPELSSRVNVIRDIHNTYFKDSI